jgi:hypothetical protein
MRNTRDAHKLKASTCMNEHGDMILNAILTFFSCVLFLISGNYQIDIVENRNKKYSNHKL